MMELINQNQHTMDEPLNQLAYDYKVNFIHLIEIKNAIKKLKVYIDSKTFPSDLSLKFMHVPLPTCCRNEDAIMYKTKVDSSFNEFKMLVLNERFSVLDKTRLGLHDTLDRLLSKVHFQSKFEEFLDVDIEKTYFIFSVEINTFVQRFKDRDIVTKWDRKLLRSSLNAIVKKDDDNAETILYSSDLPFSDTSIHVSDSPFTQQNSPIGIKSPRIPINSPMFKSTPNSNMSSNLNPNTSNNNNPIVSDSLRDFIKSCIEEVVNARLSVSSPIASNTTPAVEVLNPISSQGPVGGRSGKRRRN
jgi:hypothetical protein